ncbi:MAG TPA: 23S rRNA (pseudouridine(1915)-N(3))-methyltransferase RlmH [Solirubrobacteraceae bacterium]|nr:23S rRNA (pseudouridine(1915)-N(3))-methyltransferase RlmH [Solirubrobacteraceae bacterium]
MKVRILAIGRLRPPYVDDVDHYLKMLTRYARVEVVELREGDDVERRIGDRSFVVQLDERGRQMTSEGLAAWLEERRQSGRDLCFVIGGPYGIELARADLTLSLGRMTLPHQLARVVLVEQLYRAHRILAGEPYHHG